MFCLFMLNNMPDIFIEFYCIFCEFMIVYLEKEIAKRQSLNGDKENIPDVEVKELQNSLQQTKEELDQWLLDAAVYYF